VIRRRWTAVALVGVAVTAFLVSLPLTWWLPFPWGSIAALAAAAGIGWWGGSILYRVRSVERRADVRDPEDRRT
jgi:hypothetical protein